MPGIPFQSKLEPFYDFIRESRAKRWSYVRIAQAITQEHGMKVCAGTVFSFVKVRAKKRKLYALPPRHDFGFAASNQVTGQPVGKDLALLAPDSFVPTPEPNGTQREKRPYRLEF